MSVLFVLLFTLPAIVLIKKKKFPKIFILSITSYLSIASFILLTDFLARVGVQFTHSIFISMLVYLFVSSILIVKSKVSSNVIKSFFTIGNKTAAFFLLITTLVATFLLSKFIFNNGLHDEYQHHDAVTNMINNNNLPIRDELKYGKYLSEYYHYGWYYIVMFVSLIFSVSVELALDVVKLALFIPIIPMSYAVLQNVFKKLNWKELTFFSLLLVFQGPSLFLLDNYSKNVLFGQNNLIIYQPLFFQLAGITWYGYIYVLIFSIIFYYLLVSEKIWKTVLFSIFSLLSMFLLNKVYILLLIFVYFVLLIIRNFFLITKMSLKHKYTLLFVFLIGLFFVNFIFKFFFPVFYNLSLKGSLIPFIRSVDRWGFPYEINGTFQFAKLLSLEFITSFGIMPIISLLILLSLFLRRKQKNIHVFILSVQVFLFALPYFVHLSGSELVFNKFYIPFMTMSLMVIFEVYQKSKKIKKQLLIFLTFTSVLTPLLYFSSLYLPNLQRYWSYSDAIIEKLILEESDEIIIVNDDNEYGKFLVNNLSIQLISLKQFDVESGVNASYLVSKNRNNIYELVTQTDSHYLYKIK